jgi:DNA excision repair protein ERCC-2
MRLLNKMIKHKLIFVETPSTLETSISLQGYRKACDSGRGAIFFSIARGKVSEGIDFDGHYGRCVIMFGIPYVNSKSKLIVSRLEYIEKKYKIKSDDFLAFDALRQCNPPIEFNMKGKKV